MQETVFTESNAALVNLLSDSLAHAQQLQEDNT